jgi:hypothetical protein
VDDGGGHSNSLMNNFIALGLGYNRQSIKILLRRNWMRIYLLLPVFCRFCFCCLFGLVWWRFVLFLECGDWTQGLSLANQVLSSGAQAPLELCLQPFCLFFFSLFCFVFICFVVLGFELKAFSWLGKCFAT